MRHKSTTTLDFPATDNTFGTTKKVLDGGPYTRVTVAWNGGQPATDGAVHIRTTIDGGESSDDNDLVTIASFTTSPGTVDLANVAPLIIQGKSGTGTGTLAVTVIAK